MTGHKPCHSAPSTFPSWKVKESRERDIPHANDGCTPAMKKKCLVLLPVTPFSTGEGLPYAPINWPSPGDNWSWKAGKKVARSGHYYNRYLYPPISLQKPGCTKLVFAAMISLEQYIRTEFPDADIDAFFSSFSWKIMARKSKKHGSKVKSSPQSLNIPGDKDREEEGETAGIYARKRRQNPARVPSRCKQNCSSTTKNEAITVDLTEDTETSDCLSNDSQSASDFEYDHVSSVRKESVMDASQEHPGKMISEDYEYSIYLKSNLAQDPSSQENEMAEARKKLSSLLSMDFPLLISTENLTELQNLLSKLQKDSRLTMHQRIKLQIIDEIPLMAKHYMETKKYTEDADNFLSELEIDVGKATSLNNQYMELKKKAAQHQAEIDSNLSAIKDLDYQILQLQTRRAELAHDVELKKVDKNKLLAAQGEVIESIYNIMQKIELCKSEKHEWELKKVDAAKRVAEIHAKFESLRGFSL